MFNNINILQTTTPVRQLKGCRLGDGCFIPSSSSNITNRTDIGDYNYSQQNAGPHAVTSLSNTTGTLLPATSQAVDYTAFNKASHITQSSKDYFITYGPDRLRTKTSLQSGIGEDILLTKYYALGDFEKETDANGTRELHYIAGGDGLAAIYVKYDTGADSLFYVMQDHLGSLVGAINAESDKVYRQSFDAWGRERNPTTWGYTNLPDDFPFMRGYTGHEHLKWFGLINMLSAAKSRSEAFAGNGRMYDPVLCRFLSPDPYVQMPDNSQNFNRYSYCLNNPLVYTDPSGKFFLGTIITGGIEFCKAAGQTVWDFGETIFVDGGLEFWHGGSGDAWAGFNKEFNNSWAKFDPTNPGTRFNNAVKIDVGGFKGNFGQIVSRWTWELPQTLIGKGYGHFSNNIGRVTDVNYFDGATVVNVTDLPLDGDQARGVSLGSFIYGQGISSNPFETYDGTNIPTPGARLLRHEYGHYRQSLRNGWTYLPKYGIPSASGANWTEVDAEYRSDKYFSDEYDASPVFYSYPAHYSPVNAKWWEHVLIYGGGNFFGGSFVSILNITAVRLNFQRLINLS